jgi:hypothetical protein
MDIEELRVRLGNMTDGDLRKFGEAAKFMCSPGANLGKPPLGGLSREAHLQADGTREYIDSCLYS